MAIINAKHTPGRAQIKVESKLMWVIGAVCSVNGVFILMADNGQGILPLGLGLISLLLAYSKRVGNRQDEKRKGFEEQLLRSGLVRRPEL